MSENNSQSNEGFISLADASKKTGYHQDYLGYLCRIGKLKGFKIGRNWVTTSSNLDQFLSNFENDLSALETGIAKKIPVRVENPEPQNQTFLPNDLPVHSQLTGLKREVLETLEQKVKNISAGLESMEKTVEKQNHEMQVLEQRSQVVENNLSQFPSKPVEAAKIQAAPDNDLKQKFASNFVFDQVNDRPDLLLEKAENKKQPDSQKFNIADLYSSFKNQPKNTWQLLPAAVIASAVIVFGLLTTKFLGFTELAPDQTKIVYQRSGQNFKPAQTTPVISSPTSSASRIVIVQGQPSQVTIEKVLGIDQSALYSLIDDRLNQYLAEGKFKGEKGDQGSQGASGANGSSAYQGGVSYLPPVPQNNFSGGSLLGTTFLSAEHASFTNLDAGDETINGSSNFNGPAVFNSSATFNGTTTIANLNISGFNPGFSQGSVVFQGQSGLTQDNSKFFYNSSTTQLSIGTNTATSSAIVQLDSTSKGFLAPRMTQAQRDSIVSPAAGLLIYNTTTNQYNFFDGTSWSVVGTGSGGSGNGTVATGTAGSFAYYPSTGTTVNSQGSLFFSGNKIGLGTSTPSATLVIQGTSTAPTVNPFDVASSTGTNLFRITPAGRVGIGVASPNYQLDVAGALQYQNKIVLANVTGGDGWLAYDALNEGGSEMFSLTRSGAGLAIQSLSDLLLQTGSVNGGNLNERVRIVQSTGNVGINTSTPVAKLSVQGSGGANDVLELSSSSGASLLRVTSAGNVGIGSSSPAAFLGVNGSALFNGSVTLTPGNVIQISGVSGNPGSPASGMVYYDSTAQKFKVIENGTVKILCNTTDQACGSGTGSAWSGLSNPTGNLALTMSGNTAFTTNFAWATNTAASNLFTLNDSAGNTGTGILFALSSGNSSSLNPFSVTASSVPALYVNNSANVGIGTTTPLAKLVVQGQGGNNSALIVASSTGLSLLTVSANGSTTLSSLGSGVVRSASGSLFNGLVSLTSDVSGVLGVSNGGTGTSTLPTVQGQLLADDGTHKFAPTNLIAGSNITITTTTPGQITIASAASALSGGTTGLVARWTSSSTLSTGLFIDNSTVTGINATSSAITFNLQGNSGTNDVFNVSSSSGTSYLRVTSAGNVGIGTATPATTLDVNGPIRFNGYTQAGLPSAGVTGRIARVTDGTRSLWMDQGSQWFSLTGDVVNVKEFGAKGDGSTDDSAAISSAIAAVPSNGGTVWFPTGTYSLGTTGITIPTSRFNLRLAGNATLTYAGTSQAILIGSTTTDASRLTLEDLKIDITNAGNSASGILAYRTQYLALNRLYVTTNKGTSTSQEGIVLDGTGGFSSYTNWLDTQVTGLFNIGLELKGPSTQQGHNNGVFTGGAVFVTNATPTPGSIGVLMGQGGENVFTAMDVENFSIGYKIDAPDNVLNAARTEGNTKGVVMTSLAAGSKIIGGDHLDGITDNSGLSAVQGTITSLGLETHLTPFSFQDGNLEVTGNFSHVWDANGGSAGLFWRTSSTTPIDASIYDNGTLNIIGGTATTTRNVVINAANSSGLIQLQNQGSNIAAVTSSGVGINTTTPTQALGVVGSIDTTGAYRINNAIRLLASANYTELQDGAGNTRIHLGNANDPTNYYSNNAHIFRNGAGNTEYMRITSAGNVGIGTSTPGRTLTVVGDIRATGILYDSSNSAGTNGMVLQTTGTGYSWVATSTLGFGSPLSGGTTGLVARWTSPTTLSTGLLIDNGTVSGVNATSSTITFNLQGSAGTNDVFNISSSSGTSFLRVTSGGNVGIGTTTPNQKFQISGGSFKLDNNQQILFRNAANNGDDLVLQYTTSNNTILDSPNGVVQITSPAGAGQIQFLTSGSQRGVIDQNGNLGIGTASPSSTLSIQAQANTNPFQIASSTGANIFQVTASNSLIVGGFLDNNGAKNSLGIGPSTSQFTSQIGASQISESVIIGGSNTIGRGSIDTGIFGAVNTIGVSSFGSYAFGYGNNLGVGSNNSMAFGALNTVNSTAGFAAAFGNSSNIDINSDNTRGALVFGNFLHATNYNMVFGQGFNGSNNLTNSIKDSAMFGFNSNAPTLFIGTAYATSTTGGVAIGTTSTASLFTIQNTSTSTLPILDIASSSGSSLLRIIASGNVGIGSSSPGSLFVVSGGTSSMQSILPIADNTYDLGSSSLRWKTLNVGPGSVVVHNDTTNTLKATLDFSGSNARLVTDSASPLQITSGANTGLFVRTDGSVNINTSTQSAALYVQAPAGSNNAFVVASSNGSSLLTVSPAGNLSFTGTISGGSVTPTGFSQGPIVFGGSGGQLSQNAGLIWDNTNNRLAINSSTPNATLVVQGSSTAPTLDILRIASSSNSTFLTVAANGSTTLSSLGSGVVRSASGSLFNGLVSLTSDVSGVLGVSNGGTGTSTAPTIQGQILSDDGTHKYTPTNLVAGSNITITTTTPGQITIAATGSVSGTGTNGFDAIWNGASSLSTGKFIDNGTVLGVNASSSSITFNLQGNSGSSDVFNVSSSSGTSYLYVTSAGNVGVGTSVPSQTFMVNGNSLFSPVTDSNNVFRITTAGGGTLLRTDTTAAGSSATYALTLSLPTSNTLTSSINNSGLLSMGGAAVTPDFAPTSGTGKYIGLNLVPYINQTGNARGITRGEYINPLPSSAADFRALELSTYNWTLAPSSTITTAQNVVFGAPTLTFSSSTAYNLTNAYNVNISGPPSGTAASTTITNSAGLNIQGGSVANVTNGYGLLAAAPTGASNNYAAAFTGGNVGVGTSTPGALLSLQGSSGSTTGLFSVASSSGTSFLTVAANGSTTLSSLGSGIVRSSSGSLFNGSVALGSSDVSGILAVTNGGIGTSTLGNLSLGTGLSFTAGDGNLSIIGTSTTISLGTNVVTTLATGTTGSIFNGSIGSNTLTLNLPFASGVNTGQLQAADFLTFNNKLSGSLTNGFLIRATGASSTAISIIADNGTVAGVNATSSTITFNLQGSAGGNDIFNVSSSTGVSVLRVTNNQRVGIGSTTPNATLVVQGTSTSPTLDIFRVASSSNTTLFNVLATGNVGIGNSAPTSQLQIGTGTSNSPSSVAQFGASSTAAAINGLSLVNSAAAAVSNEVDVNFHVAGTFSATGKIGTILMNSGTAASDLAFSNYNGSLNEKMRITSAGNVGIGTSSPTQKLHVMGSAVIDGQGGSAQYRFENNGSFAGALLFDPTTNNTFLYSQGSGSTPRMTITSAGNIGIGTTSPASLLQVAGDIQLGSKGNASAAALIFNTGSTTNQSTIRLLATTTLASSYNLTLPTTTPSAGQIMTADASGNLYWSAAGGGSITGSGATGLVARWTSASALSTGLLIDNGTVAGVNATSSTITFNLQGSAGTKDVFNVSSSSGSSYLRVTSAGNLGIGTTTPAGFVQIANEPSSTDSTSAALLLGTQALAPNDNVLPGGPFIGINASSGVYGTNSFFDFQQDGTSVASLTTGPFAILSVNGGVNSPALVDTAGHFSMDAGGISLGDTFGIFFNNNAQYNGVHDVGLMRNATNVLQVTAGGDTSTLGSILANQISAGTTTLASATLFVQGTSSSPTLPLLAIASSSGSTLLTVASNGNVGINSSTPVASLSIQPLAGVDPFIVASSTGASTTYFSIKKTGNVGVGTSTPASRFVVAANCASIAGNPGSCSDYAELYPASEAVMPGELVSVFSSSTVATTSQISYVKKSHLEYESNLLGIVSTQPAMIVEGNSVQFMNGADYHSDPFRPAIALAGRVPVKVTNENGSIQPGDYLTSSAQFPGFAMKATRSGQVVGQALESFNGDPTVVSFSISAGSVMTFVKAGYQSINNTFVLGGNDGQLANATSTPGVKQPESFVINQKGSGNILQLQKDGMDKFVVDDSGAAFLYGSSTSTAPVLSVITASTTMFSINSAGDLTAKGIITVGHKTAGTAVIKTGDNEVKITFDSPYPMVPKVLITAQGLPNFYYGVTKKDQYGFTITTNQPVTADFSFDWVALNQPDDNGSGQSSQNLSVVSSLSNGSSGSGGSAQPSSPPPADPGATPPSDPGQVAGTSTPLSLNDSSPTNNTDANPTPPQTPPADNPTPLPTPPVDAGSIPQTSDAASSASTP